MSDQEKEVCVDDVCKLDLTDIEDGEVITRVPLGECPWCKQHEKEVIENGE